MLSLVFVGFGKGQHSLKSGSSTGVFVCKFEFKLAKKDLVQRTCYLPCSQYKKRKNKRNHLEMEPHDRYILHNHVYNQYIDCYVGIVEVLFLVFPFPLHFVRYFQNIDYIPEVA